MLYIKRLDEIRGIAVFLVLFIHWLTYYKMDNTLYSSIMYGLLNLINDLWDYGVVHGGVVIFIVLSGFLIHLPRVNNKKFNFFNFIKRRLIRIVPLMYFGFFLGFIVLISYSIFNKSFNFVCTFYSIFISLDKKIFYR